MLILKKSLIYIPLSNAFLSLPRVPKRNDGHCNYRLRDIFTQASLSSSSSTVCLSASILIYLFC